MLEGPKETSIFHIPFLLLHIPPAQRINVLLILALWIWYVILLFLTRHKVDIHQIIQTRPPFDLRPSYNQVHLIRDAKKLAIQVTKVIFPLHLLNLFLFLTDDENEVYFLGVLMRLLPFLQFVLILGIVVKESRIIMYCVARVLIIEPGTIPLRNTYVLISDTLTSFAKPLVDFTLFTSLIVSDDITYLDLFIAMLPVMVRLLQCLREYRILRTKVSLFNALKYFSNLPVVVCAWYYRTHREKSDILSLYDIQNVLLLIYSIYAFYWDVCRDWVLEWGHISKRGNCRTLSFNKWYYIIGIMFDFIIRFWWMWDIVFRDDMVSDSVAYLIFDGEGQYLEVLRRGIWIIFKLESACMMELKGKESEK